MKKLHLRKRIKETIAMALSLLMVFSVVGIPIKTDAKDYSYNGHDNLSDGQFFFEGDTLSFTENGSYYLCRTYFDKQRESYIKIPFTGGTYVTGDYYQNAVYTFPGAEEDVPDEIKDSRLKMVYEYLSAFETDFGRELLFMSCYGIQVQYLDSERSVVRIDYTYYDITGDNYLGEHPSSAGSLSDDDELGEFIGWSTNPDYVDETSTGLFVEPEDDVTFDKALSYVSNGVLVLYPVYAAEEIDPPTITMADYTCPEAGTVSPVVTNVPEGRTSEIRYYDAYDFEDNPETATYTTTAPATVGSYVAMIYVNPTETQRAMSATDTFNVTRAEQDAIVCSFDGKGLYLGQTFNVNDYVTGVKDNAEVTYHIYGNGTRGDGDYPTQASSAYEIKVIVRATDNYDSYESGRFAFPIERMPWPGGYSTFDREPDAYSGTIPVFLDQVVLTPPEGFLISDYYPEHYNETLTIVGDEYNNPYVYYRKKDNGARTTATSAVEKAFIVDSGDPKIMPGTLVVDGEPEDGDSLEVAEGANSLEFDVVDMYDRTSIPDTDPTEYSTTIFPSLASVTVDGETVSVESNQIAHVSLTNENAVEETYTIVAKDFVGHETTWTVTLNPAIGDTPDPAYIIVGTQGSGDYYTSDVYLKAPDGYKITATPEVADSFVTQIAYDYTITQVWLKNTSDGTYTEAIDVEEILIDKEPPEIELFDGDSPAQITDGVVTLSGEDGLWIIIRDSDSGLASATVNGETVDVEEEAGAHIQVLPGKTNKEIVITAKDAAGLTVSRTVTLAASDKTAEGEAVAISGLTYTGVAQNLVEPQNVANGTIVYSRTETGTYTETVPTGVNAGTYTIWYKVVGDDAVQPEEEGQTGAHAGYKDTTPVSVEITIAPKTVGLRWSTEAFTYDGDVHCPTAEATGVFTNDVCTVTVTGGKIDAGEYTAKAITLSSSDYQLPDDVTTTFTIGAKTATLTWGNTTFTYDGASHVPTATVSNLESGDNCTVTVTGAQTDAGVYTATATALSNDNYALPESATTEFTIGKKTATLNWADTTFTYDGNSHVPTATVSNLENGESCTVTVGGAQTDAGTYTATATALSNENYALSGDNNTTEFTIGKKAVEITAEPAAVTGLVYDGAAHALVTDGTVTGGKLLYSLTVGGEFTDSIPTAKNAGEYTVYYRTVATDDNYREESSAISSLDVTIEQKVVDIRWGDPSFTYNKQSHCPAAEVYATSLVQGDTCELAVEGAQVNAGTYTATATALSNSNYKLPDNPTCSFTIKPVVAELEWEALETYYTGEYQSLKAEVRNSLVGDTCEVTVTGGGINAGRYTLTATALSNSNYALPENATHDFVIGRQDAFIVTAPTAKTLTYNGQNQELVEAGTATTGGKVVYALESTANFSDNVPVAKEVGEYEVFYTVEATDSNHDGGSEAGELLVAIAPRELGMTWSGTEFTYDGNEHAPTVTLTNVVSGDNVTAVVSGAKKEVGKYTATVTISGEDASNYKLPTDNTVEFTIKAKPEEPKVKKDGKATVSMGSFTYGGAATTPVVSSTTNDASKAVISYKAAGAPDDAYGPNKPGEAGTYTVRAVLPANDDYNACTVTANFSINYMAIPDGAYDIGGKEGNGGWYVSEVKLTPGDGFEISVGNRGNFTTNPVVLTEEMAGTPFYIRNVNTGEQSAGVTVASMRIDVDKPQIMDMQEDKVYYSDAEGLLIAMAKDKNFDKVFINGKEVAVKDDGNGNKIFELPIGKKKIPVTVKVVDLAGNTVSMDILTAPEWLKTGIIREGDLYLETNAVYHTPEGKAVWMNNLESTKYMGGITFFSKQEGDFTFYSAQ